MATRRARRGKVVFVRANPRRRRSHRRHRRSNPAPVLSNPYRRHRRHARRANPFHRRHRRRNPVSGGLSLGRNLVEKGISILSASTGYFGALYANKLMPATTLRYRGAIFAALGLLASMKIREKHLQYLFLGFAVEGGVDVLRQNVGTFATLSADDASEHLMGAGMISSQRGSPALGHDTHTGLGYDYSMQGESLVGESLVGVGGLGLDSNW
jgi:hypothetical protein